MTDIKYQARMPHFHTKHLTWAARGPVWVAQGLCPPRVHHATLTCSISHPKVTLTQFGFTDMSRQFQYFKGT